MTFAIFVSLSIHIKEIVWYESYVRKEFAVTMVAINHTPTSSLDIGTCFLTAPLKTCTYILRFVKKTFMTFVVSRVSLKRST